MPPYNTVLLASYFCLDTSVQKNQALIEKKRGKALGKAGTRRADACCRANPQGKGTRILHPITSMPYHITTHHRWIIEKATCRSGYNFTLWYPDWNCSWIYLNRVGLRLSYDLVQ